MAIRLRHTRLHRERVAARDTLDAIDRVLGYPPHPSRTSDPVRALCDRSRNIAQALHLYRACDEHDHDHAEDAVRAGSHLPCSASSPPSSSQARRGPAPGVVTSSDGTTCDCYECDGVCDPHADAAGARIGAVITLTSALAVIITIAALVGLL